MSKTENRWWIADLHLGHEKCCTEFKRPDGSPLRPFANADEMNEALVSRWNARVGDNDRVYVLGDVVINRRFIPQLARLKGKLTLVRGNHDIFDIHEYLKYFDEVHGCLVFDGFIATHVPVHPDSLARFKANVHGHLHCHRVMKKDHGRDVIDPRYYCVSVEHTDYAPLAHDELIQRIKEQA